MAPLHHHFELGGWDEEKITLRFWIVGILAGPARRHAVPGLDQCARLTVTDDDDRPPIDLDALTLDDVRGGALDGRPVTVLGPRPQRDRPRALPRTTPGARVTVYDGRPADELERRDRAARRSATSTLRLGPDVDPASTWADAALVATSPSITPDYPTTEPRLRAQLQALVAARAARRPRRARARQPRRTCSSGCARRRRSASPGPRARRRRPRWRTRSSPRTRSTRPSWAATSASR